MNGAMGMRNLHKHTKEAGLSGGKDCIMRILIVVFSMFLAPFALAQESAPGSSGEVRVPLAAYTQMINQLNQEPRGAPAPYAIGQAHVAVDVRDQDGRITATVDVTVLIETFEDEWALVPILPPGAALKLATVDGRMVQLVQRPEGLAWSTEKAGVVTMRLSYGVDARRSDAGYVLALPVPVAAATDFNLVYPGTGVDLAVVPAADLHSDEGDGVTRFTASVPATSSILVSWRAPTTRPYVISRAVYGGALSGDALVWTAEFQVEVFGDGQIDLPLMPTSVTLIDIRVDGAPATVLEKDARFGTVLEGRGLHDVRVEFLVPVATDMGPPQARLDIPRIPVSRFDLVLPGRKDVKVTPGANVVTTERDDETRATVFIPMSGTVVFTWTDAVPEHLRAQVRANASLYHVVHAEEGVLHGRGTVVYEITHGETNLLELEIPDDAQVNSIVAPAGGVSDWSVTASETQGRKKITVFLELAVSGEFVLDDERLLGAGAAARQPFSVPVLSAVNVHRQRGMVALLSGQELALKPVTETGVSPVGEAISCHGGVAIGPGTGAQAGHRDGRLAGRRESAAGAMTVAHT